VAAESKSNKRR